VTARSEQSAVRLFTGPMPEAAYLLLDIDTDEDNLSVYLNSCAVRYIGKTNVEKEYVSHPVYVFEATSFRPVTQMAEIGVKDKGSYTLGYLELRTERPMIL